jgi:inorganic phosphate transporter, PiT family
MFIVLFISVLALAYVNGANDNFKGVATLYGSGITTYKKAILWATLTTLLGSIVSFVLATALVKSFSGFGLLPDIYLSLPQFSVSVAAGAAFTVMFATRTAMPVSTTHAIVGALLGVGLLSVGGDLNLHKLSNVFFLPLLISPVLAAGITIILHYLFSKTKKTLRINGDSCACFVKPQNTFVFANKTLTSGSSYIMTTGSVEQCRQNNTGPLVGVSINKSLNTLHFLSAGALSFARGLNDTPKFLGLLLLMNAGNLNYLAPLIILAIALGGLFSSKRVGLKISKGIVSMSNNQGLTSNLVTAILVTTASINGLPVSTTHVSVGSLFGIGVLGKTADYKVIFGILLSWLLTLPVAALSGGLIFTILTNYIK